MPRPICARKSSDTRAAPHGGKRGSPIDAVVLTGAEIDQTAGLLSLRERSPFTLMATAATLAAVAGNPMFGALAPDVVRAARISPGERFAIGDGLASRAVHGAGQGAALSRRRESRRPRAKPRPMSASRSPTARRRLAYVPGAAAMTPALRERLSRANVILFDGTLFTDDEMIRAGIGEKTGRRMGHMPIDGAGRLDRGAAGPFRAAHLRAHQQHQPDSGRRLARARRVEAAGWEIAEDGHGDRAVKLDSTPDELEAALRDIGARRYHRLHPFHKLLHGGQCTKGQVQAWALNRYYYQSMIPIKDASLIARCEDSAIRREWRSRLVDHDGEGADDGGIARWLRLTDGLGLDREYVMSLRGLLPATRFAVDAYVRFVREKKLLEAIASSLTEMFSPQIITERVEGMLAGYPFVTRETLAYFDKRPPQAARDSDFALDYVQAQRPHAGAAAAGAGGAGVQVRACCGRCATRCSTPTSIPRKYRPALSRPAAHSAAAEGRVQKLDFSVRAGLRARNDSYSLLLLTWRTIGHHSFSSLRMNSSVCAGVRSRV